MATKFHDPPVLPRDLNIPFLKALLPVLSQLCLVYSSGHGACTEEGAGNEPWDQIADQIADGVIFVFQKCQAGHIIVKQ